MGRKSFGIKNMKSENKKIRNATKSKCRGIKFKSLTEKRLYEALLDLGIKADYEKYTFTLWPGFTPITPFFDQETDNQRRKRTDDEGAQKLLPKILVQKDSAVVGIRYTPDFYFKKYGIDIYIEVKGRENDVFYIKKKMFRKFLDDRLQKEGIKSLFFEVYTKKQLFQAIEIIEEYAKCTENNKGLNSESNS